MYGFIRIPDDTLYDLIEHPYFQRLRRITQLGMTYMVYPGAYHTRFHHALGAMHLMDEAIKILRDKDIDITAKERQAAMAAILLHDIGHGPFSHALETSLVSGIRHEDISLLLMRKMNAEMNGKLSLAIDLFRDIYPKKFLHQLISSQLDMDRLDYLRRDSFYTGVSEGQVNTHRLLYMLNVHDDRLVVDSKGIYSVEKFLIARRLMYWQVYLHKTVLVAENTLVKILKRAKEVSAERRLWCTPVLQRFLEASVTREQFLNDPEWIDNFTRLDDSDILSAIKVWCNDEDLILSALCKSLINRKLSGIEISDTKFSQSRIEQLRKKISSKMGISIEESRYFVYTGMVENSAYNTRVDNIKLLYRNGSVVDIAKAADTLNISSMAHAVEKFYLCYPKQDPA